MNKEEKLKPIDSKRHKSRPISIDRSDRVIQKLYWVK